MVMKEVNRDETVLNTYDDACPVRRIVWEKPLMKSEGETCKPRRQPVLER